MSVGCRATVEQREALYKEAQRLGVTPSILIHRRVFEQSLPLSLYRKLEAWAKRDGVTVEQLIQFELTKLVEKEGI